MILASMSFLVLPAISRSTLATCEKIKVLRRYFGILAFADITHVRFHSALRDASIHAEDLCSSFTDCMDIERYRTLCVAAAEVEHPGAWQHHACRRAVSVAVCVVPAHQDTIISGSQAEVTGCEVGYI